jgi:hypothetical protein
VLRVRLSSGHLGRAKAQIINFVLNLGVREVDIVQRELPVETQFLRTLSLPD